MESLSNLGGVPPSTLIRRTKYVAWLLLVSNMLGILTGSFPSAMYSVFLYFGVIRGIPRGNKVSLRWFKNCSCCLAVFIFIFVLILLILSGLLLSCACSPGCIKAIGQPSQNSTLSVQRFGMIDSYIQPNLITSRGGNVTQDELQDIAAEVCRYRALIYAVIFLIAAWGTIHVYAWRLASDLGEDPWFVAQERAWRERQLVEYREAISNGGVGGVLPSPPLQNEQGAFGDFPEFFQSRVILPIQAAIERMRGSRGYAPLNTSTPS